jgi:signal peptidase I
MRWPFTRTGPQEAAVRPKEEAKESGWSTARFILLLVVFAWVIRSLIVAPFNIPSGSMLPTLYIGDYLAVAKWPYGYSRYSFPFGSPSFSGRIFGGVPKRGDVVVFRHPSENSDLVKRVVGLPGDTVAIQDGRVILNGRPLPRQELPRYSLPISANTPCKVLPPARPMVMHVNGRAYCIYSAYRETLPGGVSYTIFDQIDGGPADDFGPVRVPSGRLFLMGDNRDDSLDSRFFAAEGGIGMVPAENLIGRAIVTFWSTDGSASYWKPWTWFTALRGTRIGNGYRGEAE